MKKKERRSMGSHRREEVGRKRESKEGKKERKTGFFLSFLSIVSFFFSFFIRQGEVQKKEGPESMRSCKCLFVSAHHLGVGEGLIH